MSQIVYLMVGIPASGKSTYAYQEAKCDEHDGYTTRIISRDAIRFAMLGPRDDYFSHEKEVFDEFVLQINDAIKKGIEAIFVDATHLNYSSRKKILNRIITGPDTYLTTVTIECPLEVALKRNSKRSELERVPDKVITNMKANMTDPMSDLIPLDKYGFQDISHLKITYKGEYEDA